MADGENRVGALVRAARMDLCGPMEKAALESCEGGFLCPSREQVGGWGSKTLDGNYPVCLYWVGAQA